MGTEQGLSRKVLGELPFIPERETVVIDAALDVDSAAVGFVDHGVEKGFAEGLAGIWWGFVAVEAFEPDSLDEELVIEAFENFWKRIDEVVLDDLVEAEVGIVLNEAAEADAHAWVEAERIFSKEDDGSSFEVALFGEAEFFHQFGDWKFLCAGHTVGLAGVCEKAGDGCRIEVIKGCAFLNDSIPCEPAFAKEEFIERCAGEFLGHAAAAVVITTAQGDGNSGGGHANLDEVVPLGWREVDGRGDPEVLGDLLRKIFKEFPHVGQSDRASIVIASENETPTLGICKPAEGFQVVVLPRGFPLDGLVFGH